MAMENSHHAAASRQVQQPVFGRAHPPSTTANSATSPPSKRELASWWKKFRKTTENKDNEKARVAPGIFGVALADSIRYANVAISLTNEQGESFIYGYVPIVVAKCGVFLKEKATDVEGIFRLSGSAKRIKDLQAIFDSPERYGKGLDWTGYTVHDAANIFRRYLNQLPEPIVPLDFYERFRDPLRSHQAQAVGDVEAQGHGAGDFDLDRAVVTYQKLITELPPLNRQLLLYVLDLLAVFSSKSDLNRMNSANLAAIFQPGIISHPSHDMAPKEYRLSQDVLIFLIENQDNFLFGMSGTAVDEKTRQDMESGPLPIASPKVALGRSTSNASASADSLRKFGRRNSISSKTSKGSTGAPSPGTPGTPLSNTTPTGGVHRSNTVPTKRSPALASGRFQRPGDSPSPSGLSNHTPPLSAVGTFAGRLAPQSPSSPRSPPHSKPGKDDAIATPAGTNLAMEARNPPLETKNLALETKNLPQKKTSLQNLPSNLAPATSIRSPTRERKIANIFARSPILGPRESDSEQREGRQINKLRKKKIPGSANESAQSSQNSLHADATGAQTFHTPLASPELANHNRIDPLTALGKVPISNQSTTRGSEERDPARRQNSTNAAPALPGGTISSNNTEQSGGGLKPPKSPESSIHSHSTYSDYDGEEEASAFKPTGHRNRWRFSSSAAAKKNGGDDSPLVPPPLMGQNPRARGSNSSLGSSSRARKSFTGDSQQTQPTTIATTYTDTSSIIHPNLNSSSTSHAPQQQQQRSSQESSELLKDYGSEPEKKGLFEKLKAKITQSNNERKEKEAEREREKEALRSSPAKHAGSGLDSGNGGHRHPGHNLSASASDRLPHRPGRTSIDQQQQQQQQQRENILPSVSETEAGTAIADDDDNNMGIMSPVPPTPVTAIKVGPEPVSEKEKEKESDGKHPSSPPPISQSIDVSPPQQDQRSTTQPQPQPHLQMQAQEQQQQQQ